MAGPAPLRIGVVGAGALGYHHVRLMREMPETRFVGFYEIRPDRAAQVSLELGAPAFDTLDALLSECDALTVVVPTPAHFAVAKAALARGKHLLVEKPIAASLDEADELLDIARRTGALVQTGHVERFNRAVRGALAHVDAPRFIDSDRLAPFNPRGSDVAVVLDLMIHDIDLVLTLVNSAVSDVSAVGVPVLTPTVDIANARIAFASGAVANITSSRVSRDRMRKVRIFQRSGYLSLDLATGEGEYYRLREGLDLAVLAKGPLALEAFVERIPLAAPPGEPLKLELESFVSAVRGAHAVVVSGEAGREALAVALRIVREIERTLPALAGVDARAAPGGEGAVREVLIVAGEASGDLHAAGLATELHRLRPDLSLIGIGGANMETAGVTLLERTDTLAVMGFAEVVRQVPHHYALLRSLTTRLRSGHVALLVVIDYPGFNMKLAARAKAAGVPVLYYITPQVWAWGKGRLATLARVVDKAAAILPFEESLLRAHAIDATFVGHPLLDRVEGMPDRATARRTLGLGDAEPVLALFPGSRVQEIARHLDAFVAVARVLEQRVPGLRVVVSAAPNVVLDPRRCPYPTVRSASFTVLRAADAALCKSGTTTLEAAVAGCPLVVAYRTSRWTYAIARRLVKIPHIGLVNVVAGHEVAREFVQGALVPSVVADALAPLLDVSATARRTMLEELARVRAQLGTPGAAARVARIASELAA